jgi:hypothetical protein
MWEIPTERPYCRPPSMKLQCRYSPSPNRVNGELSGSCCAGSKPTRLKPTKKDYPKVDQYLEAQYCFQVWSDDGDGSW